MCVCFHLCSKEKGWETMFLFILIVSLQSSFSIHLSVCLPSPTSCHLSIRAASSPNLVASRFQMPHQYLTVRYVPAILKGGVSHYNQASPLPATLLAAISPGLFLSKSRVCVFVSVWVNALFQCVMKCAFISVGATAATEKHVPGLAGCRQRQSRTDFLF